LFRLGCCREQNDCSREESLLFDSMGKQGPHGVFRETGEMQPRTQQPSEGEKRPAALAAVLRSSANPIRPRFLLK